MRRFALIPTVLLLFTVAPLAAQDAVFDSGWPVVERCVGDPTPPPAGWTWDGTILLSGYAGVHGVNAAWDTPRVLTFLNEDNLWGGALSPDGNWYASPRGNFTITNSYNGITEIWEIRVYPVNGQRDIYYSVPFEAMFSQYTHGQVYWRDNEHFQYFDLISPFTGEIQPSTSTRPTSPSDGQPHSRSYFSPDWTRQIFYGHTVTSTGSEAAWEIYDLPNDEILDTLSITSPIAWKPNSSGFAAVITDGADIPVYSLGLFDRDGVQGDVMLSAPEREFGLFAIDWSANGRYLAFITFPFDYYLLDGKAYSFAYYDFDNILYIADTLQKLVIDTCLTIGEGLAWSPFVDTSLLAIMPPGTGIQNVLILDMDSYALYPVAQHMVEYNHRIYQGSKPSYHTIIGWRAD